jgi:glutaminyl-peptide cyclotransferase
MIKRSAANVVRLMFAGLLLSMAGAQTALAASGYRVIHAYPHDPQAFTQGLVYLDGHLYESTGLKGQSTLREEDLATGRVIREVQVPRICL